MSSSRSDNEYFLTRHHANLLEALARATREPGSLSVIHGDAGLGKSRLLQAFIRHRCNDRRWRLIEFLPQGLFWLSTPKSEQPPRPQHELGTVLAASGEDDLWLVDGYELALDHGREPLSEFWNTSHPRPALVLAGSLEWPDSWRERLPDNSGPVFEARVHPLTFRESEEFLSSRLCPRAGQRLVLNRPLRRVIRQARGRVPRLLELAGSQPAECRDLTLPSTTGWRWGIALALLVPVVVLLGRYWPLAGSEPVQIETAVPARPAPVVPAKSVVRQQDSTPSLPEASASVARESVSLPVESPVETELSVTSAIETVTPAKPPSEASPVRREPPAEGVVDDRNADLPLLQQRLQATRKWLQSGDGGRYSIQLMTLGGSKDSAASLQRFLKKLQGQGVDPGLLWIYHASSDRRPKGYFGLLHGRYETRDQAASAIAELPPGLRVKRPLLRSLEALRKETGIP